jgi:hypothetical protein
MLLQDRVEHDAEMVAQVPFLARRVDFRACACGDLSSLCGVVVMEHVPGAFVGAVGPE